MDNVVVVGLAALLALAVGLAVRRWLVFLTTVESESMLPTLAPGQQLLTRRPATSRPLRRGDIVVVDSDELGRVIVKRVAGLPGDCLRLDDGVTYEVPPGRLFLLGDNRARSSDGRSWRRPYVPFDRVLGRVILPLRRTPGPAVVQGPGPRPCGRVRAG